MQVLASNLPGILQGQAASPTRTPFEGSLLAKAVTLACCFPSNVVLCYEDKIKQTIDNVSREEMPVSFGMVIDTSGSRRE